MDTEKKCCCVCPCECKPERLNWFLGALPWLVPTLITTILAIIGTNQYKSIKNYEYAYSHCAKSLEASEKIINSISEIYLTKVSTLINTNEFKTLLDKKYSSMNRQERLSAISDMIAILNKQNGTNIEKFNSELNKIQRMIRTSNPALNQTVEDLKTFDLATLLEIHKGQIERGEDSPDQITYFYKGVNQLDSEMKKQFTQRSKKDAIIPKLESLDTNFDHLVFLKECVKNTHSILND